MNTRVFFAAIAVGIVFVLVLPAPTYEAARSFAKLGIGLGLLALLGLAIMWNRLIYRTPFLVSISIALILLILAVRYLI